MCMMGLFKLLDTYHSSVRIQGNIVLKQISRLFSMSSIVFRWHNLKKKKTRNSGVLMDTDQYLENGLR